MGEVDRSPARVAVRELRQNLSVYLDRVKAGETLEVTERGEPVTPATLRPRDIPPPLPNPSPGTSPLTDELLKTGAGRDDRAAGELIGSPALRTLDAVHLASALTVAADLDAFVTYDDRLADAARTLGLPVVRPA